MYLTEEQYNHILKQEVKVRLLEDLDGTDIEGLEKISGEKDQYIIVKWKEYLELEKHNFAIFDTDFTVNISRTLNRERISKPFILAELDNDFYHQVNKQIKYFLKDDCREQEKLRVKINGMMTSRIRKICELTSSGDMTDEIENNLSYEELNLYKKIRQEIESFTSSMEFLKK